MSLGALNEPGKVALDFSDRSSRLGAVRAKGSLRRARWFVLGAIAGAAIAAGGVAYAAIPDGGHVIHACYSTAGATTTGGTALNVVDSASASCSASQTAVQWTAGGSAIVQRLNLASPVTVTPGTPPSVPPIFAPPVASPWHFTQPGNTLELFVGSLTVTTPSSCTLTAGHGLVALFFFVYIDGKPTGAFSVDGLPAGATSTVNLGELPVTDQNAHYLYGGATSSSHTLDFQVQSDCSGNGQNFVLQKLQLAQVATS